VEDTFDEIIRAISGARRIGVTSHARPDGDAVGSAVALGLILQGEGKEVVIVNCDPVPESLRFLPGAELIETPEKAGEFDLVIVLDSADKLRLGKGFWEALEGNELVINIDHHISNTGYADINYVDADSPATGQIVYQLASYSGWSVSPDTAQNLYAAISTDTGGFRYPSTSSETMRIAGELIEIGVDVGDINQRLYENYPRRRVEMLQYILEGMEISEDGRFASVSLPRIVSEQLNLQIGDTEGAIDTIRSIDSVIIAVLFEELSDGMIRVSSRSKNKHYSVGEICAEFGGGGHTLAAGARIAGPIETARVEFMSRVAVLMSSK
jgi:phosphoesterase RecJ-like protein|tara:strand:+ start:81286 stop:82260 length:975 start_codon:yes stop_codon:yes gene_type:complete